MRTLLHLYLDPMENVKKLRVYRGKYKKFKRARVKGRANQSLQTISFQEERRVLDEQLVKECESPCPSRRPAVALTCSKDGKKHFKCKKILSPKAISVISKRLEGGKYRNREDEREPPFMAPSANPKDYSSVCRNILLSSGHI